MKYQVTSPVAPDPSLIGPLSAPAMRSWDFVNAMVGVKYEQVG